MNIGVAGHITAASQHGPRYDPALTAEARRAAENGIWLRQNCGRPVDSDEGRFSRASLEQWKQIAESMARGEVEQRRDLTAEGTQTFAKAERLMPELLMEMRVDLGEYPLRREFVLLRKTWSYWARGSELVYFYEVHPDLESKLQILENLGLVREVTYNNVKRYMISEELADYLQTTKIPA